MIESNASVSVAECVFYQLNQLKLSGAGLFQFDDAKSFEENCMGLTLIDQTTLPIVIQIDPNVFPKSQRLLSIVEPDVVIFGDVRSQSLNVTSSFINGLTQFSEYVGDDPLIFCSTLHSDIIDFFKRVI